MAAWLSLLIIVTGVVIAYRMYHQPARSVADEKALALNAKELAAEYERDETGANKKYLGNALQVSGTVSEVSVNQQNKPVIVLSGTEMSGTKPGLVRAAAQEKSRAEN